MTRLRQTTVIGLTALVCLLYVYVILEKDNYLNHELLEESIEYSGYKQDVGTLANGDTDLIKSNREFVTNVMEIVTESSTTQVENKDKATLAEENPIKISTFANRKTINNHRTIDLETFCPNRTILSGLCQKGWRFHDPPRCIMSVTVTGRLGNAMGQYATLYALSRWNGRPAFMLPEMAKILRPYFRVTMPVLDDRAAECLKNNWTHHRVHDWMVDSYRSISTQPQKPLMLTGYPCSWTFFDHIREEIKQQFCLHEHLQENAQQTLQEVLLFRTSATFVGVHVRRGDYVTLMAGEYKGMVADEQFLTQSMVHFRSRYVDAVFVVVSDDLNWCVKNMNNSRGDVVFAGDGNLSDPIRDMALLTNCNHSIITIGTYGFWSAYLTGGETVYMTNYTLPSSSFLDVFHYEDAYLPSWTPIAANLQV